MKKIFISESQAQRLISELFSQKLVNQLSDRFRQENPELEDQVINFYINRFQKIKDSDKIQEKDITKYSWDDLRTTIDMNQPEKVDIGIDNSQVIYDKDNIKIYLANSNQACVKYGTGYNFCISARNDGQEYENYRLDDNKTIYFVEDLDRTKEKLIDTGDGSNFLDERKFVDPNHLIIIMVSVRKSNLDGRDLTVYQVTDADNKPQGTMNFIGWENVAYLLPKLKDLEHLFVPVEPNQNEMSAYELNIKAKAKLRDLMHEYKLIIKGKEVKITDFAQDHQEIRAIYDPDKKELPYIDKFLSSERNGQPNQKIYMEYLEKVRETLVQYFHEKNKMNIPN